MLTSYSSSHVPEKDRPSDLQYHHYFQQKSPQIFPSHQLPLRQLLVNCAYLLSQSDLAAARHLISHLLSASSPHGATSTERLVYHFTKALSLRLNPNAHMTSEDDPETLRSCYLSLNQITPFVRFGHLTANQAILEATQGEQAIHIFDFDIMHGLQWPPLMQAMADRGDPPMVRITGVGHDLNLLQKTGDQLQNFAQTLGLKFQFHPLLLQENDNASVAMYLYEKLQVIFADNLARSFDKPNEILVVNCVHFLHRMLQDGNDSCNLRLLLHKIKALNPKVVTVAEREASHNHPLFLQRFVEAVDHYAAVFDSLEATLPPNSKERLVVEHLRFRKEIWDIVAVDGNKRKERHEKFEWWEKMLKSIGFRNVPLSSFAMSQAKLLLRLHYPSEGYQLQVLKNSIFLCWQNQSLFSVSSWQ